MSDMLDIEDLDELRGYLVDRGWANDAEHIEASVLHGGVSNRTVWVDGVCDGPWVMKQALARLRVAEEWLSDPARIEREAAGMRALGDLLPEGAVPRLIFVDPKSHLLAMEAVTPPFEVWKNRLLKGNIEMDLCEQFGELLATLHSRSAESQHLALRFADQSFFESLRLEPYYGFTAQQTPRAAPFLQALMDDCRKVHTSLVHGDYSPKNLLIRQGRLVLLDHEVIHWGDPTFDIGFGLTHLLSKANHLFELRETFCRGAQSFWRSYRERAGTFAADSLFENRAVRHTLACLLARIDGRSPLEYLDEPTRERQRQMVLERMEDVPGEIEELIGGW